MSPVNNKPALPPLPLCPIGRAKHGPHPPLADAEAGTRKAKKPAQGHPTESIRAGPMFTALSPTRLGQIAQPGACSHLLPACSGLWVPLHPNLLEKIREHPLLGHRAALPRRRTRRDSDTKSVLMLPHVHTQRHRHKSTQTHKHPQHYTQTNTVPIKCTLPARHTFTQTRSHTSEVLTDTCTSLSLSSHP